MREFFYVIPENNQNLNTNKGSQFISLRFLSSCFSFQSFSLPEKVEEKGFPLQSGAGSKFFSFGLILSTRFGGEDTT